MLNFETLSLQELANKTALPVPYYIEHETGIEYFEWPRSWGNKNVRDTDYTFIVCTGPAEKISPRSKKSHIPVIGIAQLQINPNDRSQLWLPYVSVHTKHQGAGIGREFRSLIITTIQDMGLSLELSMPSDLSLEKGFFMSMISALNNANVKWSFSYLAQQVMDRENDRIKNILATV